VPMGRLAPRPSVLHVPIDQFGESVMVGKLRREAEEATLRARWRF
jgi:hypothetical protein